MYNCKDLEYQLIDYIDGTLNPSDTEALRQHLASCEHCQNMEKEYRSLFDTINKEPKAHPTAALRTAFETALNLEAASADQGPLKSEPKTLQLSVQTLYKYAAVIALALSSYWFGNYRSNQAHRPELTHLENEKQDIKRVAALSLFESESASKRILAVKYSQELEQPDDDILNALIGAMLNAKMVNVRLASARALERFSDDNLVKEAYIDALKSETNSSMQIELIELLARIKEKRAIPQMRKLLNDDNTPSFIKDQLKTELQNLI